MDLGSFLGFLSRLASPSSEGFGSWGLGCYEGIPPYMTLFPILSPFDFVMLPWMYI